MTPAEPDLSLLNEILEAGRDPNEPAPKKKYTTEESNEVLSFETPQHVLSALLKKAHYSIPVKDWLPVLRNFLVMSIDGRLRVVASTGSFTTIVETTTVTTKHPGVALLPAHEFFEVVKVAGSGTLLVKVEQERIVISRDRVRWEIALHLQQPYPAVPREDEVEFVSIDRERLLGCIEAVRYAVGVEETRPGLRMVQIKDGKVSASDGDRFQQTTLDSSIEINLPGDHIPDIIRILGSSVQEEVEIGQSEQLLSIKDDSGTYWFNKVKTKFADAENFLLKPALYNNRELMVNKQDLLTAIRHVRLHANTETAAIGLFLAKGQLGVSARDMSGGKSTEFIDAEWGHRERVLVVNHVYLTDLLRMHPGEECRFLLGDDSKSKKNPLLLRDDKTGTLGLIQQMHAGRAIYDKL